VTAAQGTNPASGGTVIPLTLKEAESIALKNNPQITIGKLRALQAQQQVREARSALLPVGYLSMTGVASQENSRIAAGGLNNPIIFQRAATGATVSGLVTDFGRTTNLVSSSREQAKAENEDAQATTADILLAVDEAYYNALETKALLSVADETVKARQALVDKVQALTNAKLKSDLDLSFAKVDGARAQLLQLESKNNYEASLATLSAILGYPTEQNFQLADETPQATQPAMDVNPLIQQALQQRPEVHALQDEVSAAEKFAHAEHDLSRPTVSAIGAVGATPVRDDHLTSWYGAVGVNVNIPVFNGFQYDARAKSADLQTEMRRQQLMDVRNNIARDVRNAWQNSNQAYERLTVTRELQNEADLSMDLAQSRYNLGLSSIVEFTQAELQKTEADIEDTDAKYRYRLTQIELAYTMASPR
jgi:outer membrane protein